MPTVYIAPGPINSTQLIPGGSTPASGGKLFQYLSGSSTKTDTYTNVTGTVKWSNPIVLDSGGNLGGSNEVWIPAGVTAKFVLAPSNDTDPPIAPYKTWDNLSGINDPTSLLTEWVVGPTPTFVSTTSFTLVGDQTLIFTPGRRVKTTNTAGTRYGTISTSVFGALTTVTIINDSGTLDAGLSAVWYGILSVNHDSIPNVVSVMRFGAFGDGVTDDTAAILLAIAYIRSVGGTLFFPAGTYLITGRVDLTNLLKSVRFLGAGGAVDFGGTRLLIKTSSASSVQFDLTGSRYFQMEEIEVYVDSSASLSAVFLLARNSTNASVGDGVFSKCSFADLTGKVSVAFFYNYGSESNLWFRCFWAVIKPAYYATANNLAALTSPFATIATGAQSTLEHVFIRSQFYQYAAGGAENLVIEGGGAYQFLSCYMNTFAKGNYFIKLKMLANTYTNPFGLRIWSGNLESRLITCDVPNGSSIELSNFIVEGVNLSQADAGSPFIDLNKSSGANIVLVDGSFIGWNTYLSIGSFAYLFAFYALRSSEIRCNTQAYVSDASLTVGNEITNTIVYIYDATKLTFSGSINNVEVHAFNRLNTSITVAASPFTYTNADNVDEIVYVNGGTVSNVTVGGQGIASGSNVNAYLHPGDAITVTYTVAPLMRRIYV